MLTSRDRRYIEALQRRERFLRERTAASTDKRLTYDEHEAAALRWAINRLQAEDQQKKSHR